MTEKFDGDGMDRSPFSDAENARHRQMMVWLGERKETINGAHSLVQGAKALRAILIVMVIIGGALGWAVNQGWF